MHAGRTGAEMGLAREGARTARPPTAPDSTMRPNLVMGTNTQVCWHKFCRYWDVEAREVALEGSEVVTDPERAAAACDENTIGVVCVLGSTFTGHYENVAGLSAALDRMQEKTGLDIPIHVDGASGGFVAPFLQPELVWDFRLPRVKSINTSGHKYGLVYPGVGWMSGENGGPSSGTGLQRGLSGRINAHAGHQLFASREPDRGAVLQPDPAGRNRDIAPCMRHAARWPWTWRGRLARWGRLRF